MHALALVPAIVSVTILGILVLAFAGLAQPYALATGAVGTGGLVALFKYWPFGKDK